MNLKKEKLKICFSYLPGVGGGGGNIISIISGITKKKTKLGLIFSIRA